MNDQMPMPSAAEPQPTDLFGSPVYGSYAYGMSDAAVGPSKVGLARWLVVLAVIGVVSRGLVVAACANRISFVDNLLSGGTGTIDDAHRADGLVTVAGVFAGVAFLAFLGVLVAVGRRSKRGDAFYRAVNTNPRVKVFSRIYLASFVVSIVLANAFKKDQFASAEERLRSVLHADWAAIGINAVVMAFLIAIVVVTRSEIGKARAAGVIG